MKRAGLWILLFMVLIPGTMPAAEPSEEKVKELELKIQKLQEQIDALKVSARAPDLEELRRQVAVLAEEIEKLRSGEETEELSSENRSTLGLGPSAASVYTKKQGVSIAGYGEMLYEDFSDRTDSGIISAKFDQIDFLRAVVYVGYRFNDRFLFNSEIEFEHATTDDGIGEVAVEFAHIDYRATDNLTLRGGMVLVPMGLINEFHEPTVFLGTHRPLTESLIIPTTWHENGFGVVGRNGIVDYRAYIINGLNAAEFAASGIRSGRQDGAEAKINPAFVGRIDISPVTGFKAGGSFYAGNSGFYAETFIPGEEYMTTVAEAHAEYRRGPWDFRGLYARSTIDNVERLNRRLETTTHTSVAGLQEGGYVQAGYNLLSRRKHEMSLIPYVRFEKVNTQKNIAQGYLANPARDVTSWTIGAQFLPHSNIVIKADYQNFDDPAETAVDQFNIALGYSF